MEYSLLSAFVMFLLITDPLGNIPLFVTSLKKIEKEIEKAIQERKNDVYIYAGLMPETIVSLKNLGYNVEKRQTGPYEMTLKVSW